MRVFTWDEVCRSRVPARDDFAPVVECIRRTLGVSQELSGALLIGSMLTNYSSTSDIDVLIFPSTYEALRGMNAVFQTIHQCGYQHRVPVNIIVALQEDAERGVHTITPSFLRHLQYCAQKGGVIRGSPLDCFLIDSSLSIRDDTWDVCTRKLRNFLGYIANPPRSHAEVVSRLAKVLSIAPHVCLKMLYTTDDSYQPSSNGVVSDYRRVFQGNTLRDALQLLSEAKVHYEQMLLEDVPREQYEHEIESLYASRLPFAIMFLRLNLEKLIKM